MPARKRQPHTEAWDTIGQLCLWPEQKVYELLRPVVLFGDPPGERAEQTKANERTLRRQADRFETEGMVSLFRPTKHQETDEHRSLPPPIRQTLVDLKAEYPRSRQCRPAKKATGLHMPIAILPQSRSGAWPDAPLPS